MKTLTCIIVLFFSAHIFGQNFATVKNGRVKTEVWIPKTSIPNSAASNNDYLKNQIHLSFFGNFHDTAIILLNNKQIYKGYLNTDTRRGNRVAGIILEIDPNAKDNLLSISLINSNECMLAEIETRFVNIEVYKYRNWELHYTNYNTASE